MLNSSAFILVCIVFLGGMLLLFVYVRKMAQVASNKVDKIEQDLSREKSFVLLLQIEAMASSDSATIEEASRICLRTVCEQARWHAGHLYMVNKTNYSELLPAKIWYFENHLTIPAMQKELDLHNLKRGEGLPGDVLATGKSTWLSPITRDTNPARSRVFDQLKIKSGYACPVVLNEVVVAVMEFFSKSDVPPGEECLELIGNVSGQLARVIERKEHHQQVMTAAKMSALGQMAGGIAHEINNPLAIIQGYAGQLRQFSENSVALEPIKVGNAASKIETAVSRISTIIKGLQTFARDARGDQFEDIEVKSIVDDTLSLCHEKFKGKGISVQVKGVDSGLRIRCKPVEISQVLLSLLYNSCDAIENLDKKWIQVEVADRDDFVDISITDSGPGIPPELQDKIFYPFFTTKEVGKGVGVGLSIAQRITQIHGGNLKVDSQSRNTRMVVSLPKMTMSAARPA